GRPGSLRRQASGPESSRRSVSPQTMTDREQLLEELLEIGLALTTERDLYALLERVLVTARRFTRAEAGALFLREGDHLRFAVLELLNALDESGAIVPFDPEDEKVVRALASQAAVAVRNARLEDMSFKDVSTELYNRRYFALRIDEEVKRHTRFGHPLSLVVL